MIGKEQMESFIQSLDVISTWPPERVEEARALSFKRFEIQDPKALEFINALWDRCIETAPH